MDLTDLSKNATPCTLERNRTFACKLDFADKQDFEDAQRGFIARYEGAAIYGENMDFPLWSLDAYDFENGDADCPDTVNPSLWRQSQLNHFHGLYRLRDRIYQIRGMDMSNITIIEGDTGIIVIDVLCSVETAQAGMDLYYEHCGKKDVKAVIITHSHVDHYAGIDGVIAQEDVDSGKIPIIAPKNFLFEAVAENAFVGTAMTRRAVYQYGALLPKGPKGQVDVGLGKCSVAGGTLTLLAPTREIAEKRETLTLDGVEFQFVLTPGAEAPSEFIIYLPQFKTLQTAEEVTRTLHNVLTLRGAQVRDTRMWWKYIDAMIEDWGDDLELVCATHHWPTFGHDRCLELLSVQRDMYKYMHDQCVYLINKGYNMVEVAEEFEYPEAFQRHWHMRGYYGSTNHDCKAVYQRYLGWYDANPSNLHPYPPEISAPRYVEMMGGADSMLDKLQEYYEQGDYRWVAEVGKHLVFADATNMKAANLLADAYEQLAYQCENATWRNAYLSGALELRIAPTGKKLAGETGTDSPQVVRAMTDDMFYDFISCRLNGPASAHEHIVVNLEHPDRETTVGLMLRNGVLLFCIGKRYDPPDAQIIIDRDLLMMIVLGIVPYETAINEHDVSIEGNSEKFQTMMGYIEPTRMDFNIVLP